ncbi:MAG: PKD domain-containing protein [Candidatus Hydrothermarchaeota archaeon]
MADYLTVYFTDASTDLDGTVVAWFWDFGDGVGTSTEQNPTYTYANAGSYEVTLTVTDDNGATDSVTKTVTVEAPPVNQPPIADFSWSPTTPDEGQSVQFTDASTDPDGQSDIVGWSWDFGDGATSTMQNPTHTYTSEGSYTVTLTVTESDGDTSTATDTVTVSPPVAYDGAILKVQAPKRVRVNTMGGTVSKTVTVVAEAYNTAGTTDIILQKMYGGVIKDTYYAYNVVLNPGDGASRIKFSVDISYTDISPDATGVITWHAFLSNGGSDTTNDEGVSTTQVVSYTK